MLKNLRSVGANIIQMTIPEKSKTNPLRPGTAIKKMMQFEEPPFKTPKRDLKALIKLTQERIKIIK